MNFKSVIESAKFNAKEKAPEALVVVGIASIVTGIVFACKATLKVHEKKAEIQGEIEATVEQAKSDMNDIDDGLKNHVELKDDTIYNEEDAKRDKVVVYTKSAKSFIKTGFKVAKEYAPAVGFIVVGITCVLFSHKILRDRNASLLTAYAALDSAFKAYRARVIKDGGKELDAKYLYGTKTIVEEKERVNEKTGEVEKVIETHEEIDYPLGSPYARIYDGDTSVFYENADTFNDFNRRILLEWQAKANDILNKKGHMFLYEVYEMLGFDVTPESLIVGWIKDENEPNKIDFNIDLCYTDERFDFVETKNFRRKIVLDFNVDGEIISYLKNKQRGLINGLTPDKVQELEDCKRQKEENPDLEGYKAEEYNAKMSNYANRNK